MATDLFTQEVYRPLAARMRPCQLAGFYGQAHLVGQGKPLREAIDNGTLHSMILW
ncbi:MAG: recombination factor protein RarA, partial [Porticoccaceae bacterium]|nr:recombination factor protein RarA [Porticoccaceae bacterium]